MDRKHTIKSEPPARRRPQRRSRWADTFVECRQEPGEWHRIVEPFARSSASLLASDIRNADKRDPRKSHVRGLQAGEQWETQWGEDLENGVPGSYYVWLRFLGPATSRVRAA